MTKTSIDSTIIVTTLMFIVATAIYTSLTHEPETIRYMKEIKASAETAYVIDLHRDGFTNEEIAETMDTTVEHIHSQIVWVKHRLREIDIKKYKKIFGEQ